MSRIEELIREKCPDGVEYILLANATRMQRGTSLTKANAVEGSIPVISGGKEPAFYCNTANRDESVVTVAGSGAGAGYVQYFDSPIFANDCFTLVGKTGVNTKYVYYFMQSIQKKIYETQKGAGVPHVHISDVDRFEIPVPPIQVQQEIVRILDKFTELEAELQAELDARKKQYEYMLENILPLADAEDYTLEEVFEMRNGYTPSKNNEEFWIGGTINWFRMEDIRENGRHLNDSIQKITSKAVKKSGLFKANSIALSTSATIGEHALLEVDCLTNQRFTVFTPKKEFKSVVNMEYMNYYFQEIDRWCLKHLNQGNFASVDMDALKKYSFPLPSITEQKRIVCILKKTDVICNDFARGIPAEIAARHKQYEYYRDKLLTFKRKEV